MKPRDYIQGGGKKRMWYAHVMPGAAATAISLSWVKPFEGNELQRTTRRRESWENGIKTPIEFSLSLDFSITYQPNTSSLIQGRIAKYSWKHSRAKSKIMTLRQPWGSRKHAHQCTSLLTAQHSCDSNLSCCCLSPTSEDGGEVWGKRTGGLVIPSAGVPPRTPHLSRHQLVVSAFIWSYSNFIYLGQSRLLLPGNCWDNQETRFGHLLHQLVTYKWMACVNCTSQLL